MPISRDLALERLLEQGDEWQSWRALRLDGSQPDDVPSVPAQEELGGFIGPTGRASAGATGEALCHLKILELQTSASAAIAGDWLLDVRTPAGAWLDPPDDVPGVLESSAGARVWATAAAICGLLVSDRDPGETATRLLRGEANNDGSATGGAYPTFAAAGTWWLVSGPESEMAEWALRWARENEDDWWGGWERATALTFWGAAGIPVEHPTVDLFIDVLQEEASPEGWPDDLGLTLRTLELLASFGA